MTSAFPAGVDSTGDSRMDDAITLGSSSQLSRRSSKNSASHTPKRRPARVEKPRTTHPSPRVPERRRTVNSTRPSYATLEDHYRTMFGATLKGEGNGNSRFQPTNRPFSWHPSSARFSSSFYHSSSSESSKVSGDSASQPVQTILAKQQGQPATQLPSGPATDSVKNNHEPQVDHDASQLSDQLAWSAFFGTQVPVRSGPPSYAAAMDEPTSWFLPEYSHPSMAPPRYSNLSAYQDRVSDFLPIQHPPAEAPQADVHMTETVNTLARQNSKELIGLGLYDDPETTPFNLLTTIGKGLKLEEEWQPPEDMINDSEDADGENDSSEDEEEPPRPPPAPKPAHASVQGAPQLPLMNMSGQSFLFDDADEDPITGGWWYQMKQTSAPAPQAPPGRLAWVI